MVLELITAQTTAAAVAGTDAAAVSGNSLNVRQIISGKALSLAIWAHVQYDSFKLEYKSPHLHDSNHGRVMFFSTNDPRIRLMHNDPLFPTDIPTLTHFSDATSGNIETTCELRYYDNIGINGRYISHIELAARFDKYFSVPLSHTAGTSGGYSGELALNTTSKEMKSGRFYALLGAVSNGTKTIARIRSTDTGNLGVGLPLCPGDEQFSSNFFPWLSKETGLPCIPVFDMTNPGGILCDVVNNENALSPKVEWIFALLQ